MFYKLAWQVFLLRTSAIQVNLMALGLASDETVFELSRSRFLSCEHAQRLCKVRAERKLVFSYAEPQPIFGVAIAGYVSAWKAKRCCARGGKAAKRWSSERRSQTCLDYPESRQSKAKPGRHPLIKCNFLIYRTPLNWFVFSIGQYFAKSFLFRGLYATSSVKIRSKKFWFCVNLGDRHVLACSCMAHQSIW